MCRHFCIGFIDFMLKGKSLLDYANLFSSKEYEKYDKLIPKIFQKLKRLRWKKVYCVTFGKYIKFKNPKILYIFEKSLVISIICSKCGNEDEKIVKDEESTEVLEILGLIKNI